MDGTVLVSHPMEMRYRLPELMDAKGWTAYELAKRSEGRISMRTLYRICEQKGRVKQFDGGLVEALCDTLDISVGELLERDRGKSKKGRAGT